MGGPVGGGDLELLVIDCFCSFCFSIFDLVRGNLMLGENKLGVEGGKEVNKGSKVKRS